MLVITALLGSVVIPAIESSDVLTSLSNDETIIEPARLLAAQLESEIAEEFAVLQRYAMFGDSGLLGRLKRATTRDADKLAALGELTYRLSDGDSLARDVKTLATQMKGWHEFAALRPEEVGSAMSSSAIARQSAVRESLEVATARVRSGLERLAARNRSAVVAHERRGIYVNAALVLAAFLAMASMVEANRRERRRARQDSLLRVAAQALTEAFSTEDAARQIAESAIELSHARNASVWRVDPSGDGAPRVVRSAVAGNADLFAGLAGPFRGSVVERALEVGRSIVVDIAADDSVSPQPSETRPVRAVVIPLGTPASPETAGAVVLAPVQSFDDDDQVWAATFGRLAQLAYEKVRLLEVAHAARARLERVLMSRSRLMRGFSHDVKNSLAAADTYAVLLERGADGGVTDKQRDTIGRVRRSIGGALTLLGDLHELARAETGKLPLRLECTDVAQLVVNVGDQYRAAANAQRLDLVVEVDDDLPMPVTDGARVREIVANLLSNAIKYTDEGSVVLRASGEEPARDSRCVLIRVIDTGPGIPPDKLDSIFEEFERLGARQPGAGVGLAISKHIAGAIGGHITVASELGKGSTFTLCIPVGSASGDGVLPPTGEIAAAEFTGTI